MLRLRLSFKKDEAQSALSMTMLLDLFYKLTASRCARRRAFRDHRHRAEAHGGGGEDGAEQPAEKMDKTPAAMGTPMAL